MGIDPNQIVDQTAAVAKKAIAVDQAAGGKVLAFVQSRAFWLNVVGVVGAYMQYIPAKYAPYVLVGMNVLLHYLQS